MQIQNMMQQKPPWKITTAELGAIAMEMAEIDAIAKNMIEHHEKRKLPKLKPAKPKSNPEIGAEGEADITASLKLAGLWHHKIVNAGYGTEFDKLVIPPGGGYAVEVKRRAGPTIEYSKISLSERRGLNRFERLVGRDNAFIIGIWQTREFARAFFIPWHEVRDAVCSGCRGSIMMTDFPELQKVPGGWDMSCFGRKG